MNKILFVFFMFISSPLYSNEFTFHCDSYDKNVLTMSQIYKVDRKEKTVVWAHSINKRYNRVDNYNKFMDIYHWDEENDSVWLVSYKDDMTFSPSVTIKLLNFEVQKMMLQKQNNFTPRTDKFRRTKISQSHIWDCYILE
ncbi:hypothetical protein N8367_01000 [Amylibacter sp.]|nr:hypothetical protein [Amylibacter sp.]